MAEDPIFENDEPLWRITIRDRDTGLPVDLTGVDPSAEFRALIGKRGVAGTAGTVVVHNPTAGEVDVLFPRGSAVYPSALAQLEFNRGGRWSTVWAVEAPVRISLDPAP